MDIWNRLLGRRQRWGQVMCVVIALTLAVLTPGTHEHSLAKEQKKTATIKAGEALGGARYFGLDEPREWIYEVTFETPRIFYSPFDVNTAGLLGTSVTHGSRQINTPLITFSLKTLEPFNDKSIPVVIDDPGKRFWFAPSLCKSELVVVRSGAPPPEGHPWAGKGRDEDGQWKPFQPFPAEMLALDLHLTPCSKDNKPMDWVLGEILGLVPADGRSRFSRYGWISAPASEPVVVPAGTYSRVRYSKFPRGDGQYSPDHLVESWLAEGVGLIKYRVSEKGATVYTATLKSVRKVE